MTSFVPSDRPVVASREIVNVMPLLLFRLVTVRVPMLAFQVAAVREHHDPNHHLIPRISNLMCSVYTSKYAMLS
jgi:hypothetical protein